MARSTVNMTAIVVYSESMIGTCREMPISVLRQMLVACHNACMVVFRQFYWNICIYIESERDREGE
jgi:hypothetical protein